MALTGAWDAKAADGCPSPDTAQAFSPKRWPPLLPCPPSLFRGTAQTGRCADPPPRPQGHGWGWPPLPAVGHQDPQASLALGPRAVQVEALDSAGTTPTPSAPEPAMGSREWKPGREMVSGEGDTAVMQRRTSAGPEGVGAPTRVGPAEPSLASRHGHWRRSGGLSVFAVKCPLRWHSPRHSGSRPCCAVSEQCRGDSQSQQNPVVPTQPARLWLPGQAPRFPRKPPGDGLF